MAVRANNRKTFKRLRLLNQWMDCSRQFLKKWREKSKKVNYWSKLSQIILKRPFTKYFQLHNMPPPHPSPPLWTALVFPIYLYTNMICIENWDTGERFRAIMALLFTKSYKVIWPYECLLTFGAVLIEPMAFLMSSHTLLAWKWLLKPTHSNVFFYVPISSDCTMMI